MVKTEMNRKMVLLVTIMGTLLVLGCTNEMKMNGKSGMNHEEHSTPTIVQSKKYKVAIQHKAIIAGTENEINLTVLDKDSQKEITDLEIDHEKKIHVFFLSNDMENFLHLHDEEAADSGKFTISPLFPKGGNWHVYTEWKYKGQLFYNSQDITVNGSVKQTLSRDYGTTKEIGEYTAQLKVEHEPMRVNLNFYLTKDGNQILDSLQNYLGAPMHVVIWKDDLSYFMHAHAMVQNGFVGASAALPAGDYKIWVQFKHENEVKTLNFWLKNEQAHHT